MIIKSLKKIEDKKSYLSKPNINQIFIWLFDSDFFENDNHLKTIIPDNQNIGTPVIDIKSMSTLSSYGGYVDDIMYKQNYFIFLVETWSKLLGVT